MRLRTGFLGFDLVLFLAPRIVAHRMVSVLPRLAAGSTPLLLAGCAGPLSALDPAGPRAEALALLWWIMLIGSVALFGLVMVLFILAYIKPALLRALSPTQWILAGGLVLPLPVLVLLTGAALVLGEELLPHRDEDAPMRIAVQATQWDWIFSYPDMDGAEPTVNLMHMPAGEPVDFVVTGEDVIHSFWVPRLGGKIDAIPGHTNMIRLEAARPGTYYGICAEYCGEGHDIMIFRVEAHEAADFAAIVSGDAR